MTNAIFVRWPKIKFLRHRDPYVNFERNLKDRYYIEKYAELTKNMIFRMKINLNNSSFQSHSLIIIFLSHRGWTVACPFHASAQHQFEFIVRSMVAYNLHSCCNEYVVASHSHPSYLVLFVFSDLFSHSDALNL